METQIEKWKRRLKTASVAVTALAVSAMNAMPAYAAGGDISNSTIVTGSKKLIADLTTWLLVLAPIVAVLLIIYFCIRRSAADEVDQKKWNNRIVVAIVSCIGAVIASALLNVLMAYFT